MNMRPLRGPGRARKSYVGQTFNHLTIIGDVEGLPVRGTSRRFVTVQCSLCGGTATKVLTSIVQGLTKSCGCLRTKNMMALRARNPKVQQ